jgi:hypothetical protein
VVFNPDLVGKKSLVYLEGKEIEKFRIVPSTVKTVIYLTPLDKRGC